MFRYKLPFRPSDPLNVRDNLVYSVSEKGLMPRSFQLPLMTLWLFWKTLKFLSAPAQTKPWLWWLGRWRPGLSGEAGMERGITLHCMCKQTLRFLSSYAKVCLSHHTSHSLTRKWFSGLQITQEIRVKTETKNELSTATTITNQSFWGSLKDPLTVDTPFMETHFNVGKNVRMLFVWSAR